MWVTALGSHCGYSRQPGHIQHAPQTRTPGNRYDKTRGGKPRGSRRWTILNDKIKRLYKRANGTISNTVNRTISGITTGTDAVAHESLHIKGMAAHGERGTNRSVRGNGAGEFTPKLDVKCGMKWCGCGGGTRAIQTQYATGVTAHKVARGPLHAHSCLLYLYISRGCERRAEHPARREKSS